MFKITDDQFIEEVGTRAERASELKPCPVGSEGACCRTCYVGPCRFMGKNAEAEVRGVCASTLGVVAARQFLTMCASGSAIHATKARELAGNLLAAAQGKSKEDAITNWSKLHAVADVLGIKSKGKAKEKVAEQVAGAYLNQFSQTSAWAMERVPAGRLTSWQQQQVLPQGIDREITASVYNTSVGINYDVAAIMQQAVKVSLANGWISGTIVADIKDIMVGTTPAGSSFAGDYWQQMIGKQHNPDLKSSDLKLLGELITTGKIRGIACFVDCDHPRYEASSAQKFIGVELIKNNILVISGGCNNTFGDAGLLMSDTVLKVAGNNLKNSYQTTGIPPILSLSGCIDHSRLLTVLAAVAEAGKLAGDISALPVVALAPHWFSGTALSIGSFYAASGVPAIFGGKSPVQASTEITEILTGGWSEQFGAGFRFIEEAVDIVAAVLEQIDATREKSNLATYYPEIIKSATATG